MISLLDKQQKERLNTIIELFDTAEIDLKKTEHLDSNLAIPCINELRYAGYHIAKAVAGKETDSNLDKAIGHCKRAIYDANESAVTFILENIKKFQTDYAKSEHVVSVVDHYIDMKKEIADIATRLQQNKINNRDDRAQYYKACAKDHEKLKAIDETLSIARDEINIRVANDRTKGRRFVLTNLLICCGLILGAIKLFIST